MTTIYKGHGTSIVSRMFVSILTMVFLNRYYEFGAVRMKALSSFAKPVFR